MIERGPASAAHADAMLRSNPCLLLVHTDVRRLQEAAHALGNETGWPVLSVGSVLSKALLLEPDQLRPRAARLQLETMLGEQAPGPALCIDVDLLFEPSLEMDPLAAFRNISRITRLVVAWPGNCSDGTLAYGVPEHAHYRAWRDPRVAIHTLD